MKTGKSLKSKHSQHFFVGEAILTSVALFTILTILTFSSEPNALAAAKAAMEKGKSHYAKSEWPEAIAAFEEAQKNFKAAGDKKSLAQSLHNIGVIHRNLGDYAKALSFYEKNLAIREEIGDRKGIADSLHNIGVVYKNMGDYAQALDFGNKSLALAEETSAPERIFEAHAGLAGTFAGRKQSTQAAAHYRAAIDAVESMRALLAEGEHKSGLMGTKLGAYEGLVEVLLAPDGAAQSSPFTVPGQSVNREPETVNQNGEAFSVSERMKARSFLDEMGAARFTREGAPAELLEQKRLLEARMKWLAERR